MMHKKFVHVQGLMKLIVIFKVTMQTNKKTYKNTSGKQY